MAEKDCTEVGLAEKSNPTAGEKVRERQIGSCGDDRMEFNKLIQEISVKDIKRTRGKLHSCYLYLKRLNLVLVW